MIRLPAVAGQFYPRQKKELKDQIRAFLERKTSANEKMGRLRALIVPHAGYIYSGLVAGKGFQLLQKEFQDRPPKKELEILMLGPSHTTAFLGASVSMADEWQTPLGKVKTSPRTHEFVSPLIRSIEEAHFSEHCLEVEVPFLQETLKKFLLIPLVLGDANPEALAIEIETKLTPETFILISSDLSHYHSYEKASELDLKTIQAILDLDIEAMEKHGDACGKLPILVLMHLAKQKNWKPVLLDYQNSGDTAGDKKNVVGYCSIAFTEERK